MSEPAAASNGELPIIETGVSEFALRIACKPSRGVRIEVLVRRRTGTAVIDSAVCTSASVPASVWEGLLMTLQDAATSHMVVTKGVQLALPLA